MGVGFVTRVSDMRVQFNSRRIKSALIFAMVLAASFSNQAPAAPLAEPITPLPASLGVDPARAMLGHRLFNDARLSANGHVSCESCHDTGRSGADSKSHSTGFGGIATSVNAPTVFNAAFNFRQFWNGRAGSLEDQVDAVVQNPIEMGSKWDKVVAATSRDAAYSKAFIAAYPDGVTKANIQNAIASYERTLITPDSRFDQYLRGNANALTSEEKSGYAKFKQYGCVSCHQGKNIGGNMFQKFGVMADYFADRGHQTTADLGRYLVTGKVEDMHVFKVPSLRNVALTAPYFHDGNAATLDDAVGVMFRYQLGRVAPKEDISQIVAFLKTLTGRVKSQ